MRTFSGRTYPNGFTKSRLYEIYLCYRDFDCTPEEFGFEIDYITIEQQEGKENCQWFRDSDGRLIVSGLQLARGNMRLEIAPDGFKELPKVRRVFLSYAREDSVAASKLYSELRQLGYDVWFDQESLLPGEKWRDRIEEAIRTSDFVIALLSNSSVGKRGYVQREIRSALEVVYEMPDSSIFLIPACLEKCRPSHRALLELQWIDLFPTWDAGVKRIDKALRRRRDA